MIEPNFVRDRRKMSPQGDFPSAQLRTMFYSVSARLTIVDALFHASWALLLQYFRKFLSSFLQYFVPDSRFYFFQSRSAESARENDRLFEAWLRTEGNNISVKNIILSAMTILLMLSRYLLRVPATKRRRENYNYGGWITIFSGFIRCKPIPLWKLMTFTFSLASIVCVKIAWSSYCWRRSLTF